MKNTFAKKLAVATVAFAIAATPAIALAQPRAPRAEVTIVAQNADYDHALQVALDHSGVPFYSVSNISIYYRRVSDGTLVYNVEFETPEHFYGYQINAETFEVHHCYVN